MPARFRVHCVPLALAALTIPAAFGGSTYMFMRAWTFVLDFELSRIPLGIVIAGIVPALYACAILAAVVEFARWSRFVVRRSRVQQARCWRCKYPRSEAAPELCSKCGSRPALPPDYRYPSIRTVGVAVLLASAAVVPGALLAELHITAEDQRFIAHVQSTGGASNQYRDRAWPNSGFSFVYLPGHGFSIND